MINDIKDVQTSYNLNPQRFGNLKCKQHPDQTISWVNLENDKETKLLCNFCLIKEKDHDSNGHDASKKQSAYIDYKAFLKNLYTYSTLEENDPEKFSFELVQCLDGTKQPEKLKTFMTSVASIKNSLKKEFTTEFTIKLEEFQKELLKQIEAIKQTFLTFFDEQVDSLFSRETLAIKQFKERGCKMILSAAKTAGNATSNAEEMSAYESVTSAISSMHTGKVELSYAKEHSLKVFKSLLSDFEKKVVTEGVEQIQKSTSKQIPEILQLHIFTPWKKSNTKTINFSYLHSNSNIPNEQVKSKRESLTSISEAPKIDSKRSINVGHTQNSSIDASLRKSGSNTFIIKPVPQVNSNTRRDSYVTPKIKKSSDEGLQIKLNLKSEIVNHLTESCSPKNGYLVSNSLYQQKQDVKFSNSLAGNQQQAQFAVFNSQKLQPNLQDNYLLQIPHNANNINNIGSNANSNTNKQTAGTSLFSSFSSTLRTNSITQINIPTLQMAPNENINSLTNSATPTQQKFTRKANFQKNYSTVAASTDNLQTMLQQNQFQQPDITPVIERDSRKYYIAKTSNKGEQQNLNRNSTPQSGMFLSPIPKVQNNQLTIGGLNVSEKNLSMNNHSQSQTRDNYDQDQDTQSGQSKQQNLTANQPKSGIISTTSLTQTLTTSLTNSSNSGTQGSRMKSNIIKNVLMTNPTKQITSENLKHSKEIIQEKPFKCNILQIIRIPQQANVSHNFQESGSSSNLPGTRPRRNSPDIPGGDSKRSNSNSPPKDSKEVNQGSQSGLGSSSKLEESSNFLLAQPDGYVSLYNVQGRNITQIFKERTHSKLNSVAIGRTGGMFFTAGENNKTSSIKLWIFHSHQRFSELVELKMADSIIMKIFFVKEEYASRLNKLSFAIWTQSVVTESSKNEINKSSSTLQQSSHLVNKLGIWHLEFAGNKFEGARMFNVSNVELPHHTIGVYLKDDEILAHTKDSLTLYALINDFSSIYKKGYQKFINIIKKDTMCCVRTYQQSKQTQKYFIVFTESGNVIMLNDQFNILQEKSVRDIHQKPISLENTIIYDQECDFPENKRFLHFFNKENTTLYVYDLENLRAVEEIQSYDEIKNIFFFGSGYYLGFESNYLRIWKPLSQKQEILASIIQYDDA